jgi:hypothetical protein
MEIRDRYQMEEKPSASQQASLKILEELIQKVESQKEYREKVGAEKILINGKASMHISAFNNEVLSGFITELMYHVSGTNLSVNFSKKNIQGFLNPVFTNIITIENEQRT